METACKVIVVAKFENLEDLYEVDSGLRAPDKVRTVEVADALVDTSPTFLSMSRALIDQLGLTREGTRRVRTSTGVAEVGVYFGVRMTVQDRDDIFQVTETPDGYPVRIGKLAVGQLDFVVDPTGQRLVGNPEHGGERMIELFWRDAEEAQKRRQSRRFLTSALVLPEIG